MHTTEPGRPTKERLAHAGGAFEVAETRGSTGTMTMRDYQLERVWCRKQITDQEYQAGVKLRHHWFHAGMAGHISSLDLDGVFARDFSSMGGMAKTERQAFHRQKFRDAFDELGLRACYAVVGLVCEERKFEEVGRYLNYENGPQARAAAVTLLKDSLWRLSRLWGL